MGFKSKVFGFLATAALTLSMGAGIASANTETGQGTVVIAPGSCAVALIGANNLDFDFGKWTWNGPADQYDPPANSADREGSATVRFYGPTPQGGICWATLSVELSADEQTIGASHFAAGRTQAHASGSSAWTMPTTQIMDFEGKFTGQTFWLRLNSVPNDLAPDNYEGTVTVTVSNDQPGN